MRIVGEVCQDGARLPRPHLGVASSHNDAISGLVEVRAESRQASELRSVALHGDAVAGEGLGEFGDVALGIAGVRSDRVQLHDLAGEVLVQTAALAVASCAMRTGGAWLVEIHEHPGMGAGGD